MAGTRILVTNLVVQDIIFGTINLKSRNSSERSEIREQNCTLLNGIPSRECANVTSKQQFIVRLCANCRNSPLAGYNTTVVSGV